MSGDQVDVSVRKLQNLTLNEEVEESVFFQTYSRLETHMDLLKDTARTMAYRDAIEQNRQLFEGKVVLDVGCGMGILSLFAAKAGASKVIGVENADIAALASQIVKDNGKENVVNVVQGLIEEVELPDGIQQVDIIVSEWMGNALYMEGMLHSVLFARDKWLRPGGLVLPNVANLWIAGACDPHRSLNNDFWNNVEGFDMSSVKIQVSHEAVVDCVASQNVLTSAYLVHTTRLESALNTPIKFRSTFELEVLRTGIIHSMILYFDVAFLEGQTETPVTLSTSPHAPWTHWEQTVLHLDNPLYVQAKERIIGGFGMFPSSENSRCMNFELGIRPKGTKGQASHFKYFNSSQKL
ncbi:protein arginine N-methyltransferase 1-like [Drosophila pseudoobscura]|uniref:type I protein arginine methyltransferase n=1 Tax=Drosophila pseudoobscura pseudoobscura TaxID=46245 RepID=A0A6I8VAV2_DROPS|nr:protein arginine N-methyltransferase 1 [Drosophila pseudoobscura]